MSETDSSATTDAAAGDAIGGPVEDLSPSEEAGTFEEILAAVESRKAALDAMPDGPRPRDPNVTYKRKKVFVDWNLQINYVGIYLATLTLLAVGFISLNYVFTAFFERALLIKTQRPMAESTDMVMIITLNAVFILLLVIGMAVYAIVNSHRVAGPVLRFRRALHQMHRRDYDFHVQLRRRDYLKDVAEQLNAFNNALKHKDIVVADAALELDRLARRHPDLETDLREVAANLCDVVTPIPEPQPAAVTGT